MSDDKKERNLNEGKFGLNSLSRNRKRRCFPADFKEYTCLRYRSSFQVYDYPNLNSDILKIYIGM